MKRVVKEAALTALGAIGALIAFALLLTLLALCTPAHAVMPDAAATPGDVNPQVTQANVHRTICRSGWTKTIRPKASYTSALKRKQLASGPYASKLPARSFEEDHLISLEIGGNPTSERNLWPQPWKPKDGMGAHQKDRVENALKREVCEGKITLEVAQHEILDWEAAYRKRFK